MAQRLKASRKLFDRKTHKSEIQAIRELVAWLGGTVNVTHQSGRISGSAGIPDLYIQIPRMRLAIWFEVKVGEDRLRPAQVGFIERQEACGSEVLVGDRDVLMDYVERRRAG